MNRTDDNRVLVRYCNEYDRDLIQEIVADGMRTLEYAPQGNVFVKPNLVFAYKPELYGSHAYTHTGLMASALAAIAGNPDVRRIDVGENSAVALPTRLAYKTSGYREEIKQLRKKLACPVNLFCIDEERREPVFVGGMVHDSLRVSRKMARADSMIYLPKLKCHCVCNMTGAVKLNIGICSDDERAIRHDFMLEEKIVDLLAVGWPDFIVMDAVEIGVGNEALPSPRRLGLILMGRNPLAVDMVGARLLGYGVEDVSYLKAAIRRGYRPENIGEVELLGDIRSLDALDEHAKRIQPYDDEYVRWQDVTRELTRLNSPMRFYWGPYRRGDADAMCRTGCVMGLKMFLAFFEKFAGPEAFAAAKPVTFVIGKVEEEIDGRDSDVFLLGSCAEAKIINARRIKRIDRCFTTAGDMMQTISHRLGMPSPFLDPTFILPYVGAILRSSMRKCVSLRYFQDIGHFIARSLPKRI